MGEGALTTMEERGKAVGFCETKEKEGVAPVGVGNRVPETEALEPREEATEEAAEGAAEEAAETLLLLLLPLPEETAATF
jgi:hypothetical protein